MSRKSKAKVRVVAPDPVFESRLVTRLINTIMVDGKKSTAQKILYSSFDLIKEKTKQEPLDVFNKAMENISPQLEVRTRRVGGTNYQVPMEVSDRRKKALALRWLVSYSRLRSEKTMVERLTNEIIDASNNVGTSIKKKDDTHKMAESNRAFAHFRW